ncbi:MAG: RNA-binding protein, partial [Gammaproteobacteria bacterium CG22_combo_CG10-13_8_21_14_all_40_8]
NFANEMTSVYQRFAGDESFSDQSSILGVGADSRKSLTFGVLFADFDLDGREDLFQVNGHVESDINRVQASQSYEQPAQLFWNCGESCDSQFILSPLFLQEKWIGRGVAVSDLDKDGDLDLIVTQVSRKALVLINQTLKAGHWVGLLLADDNVKNKEAIGAKVQINTNLRSYLKLQMPTKGYLSQSSSRLVFGLEKDESLKEVVVTWPDGSQQQFNQLKIDQYNTLKKPSKKL